MEDTKLEELFYKLQNFTPFSEEENLFKDCILYIKKTHSRPLLINLMMLLTFTDKKENLKKTIETCVEEKMDFSKDKEFIYMFFRSLLMNKVYKDFNSMSEYFFYIKNVLLNLNIEIISQKNERDYNFIFNHFLQIYSIENIFEIDDFLKKQNPNVSFYNEIDSNIFYNLFENKKTLDKIDPLFISKYFNIKKINIFLISTKKSFDINDLTYLRWINFLIENDGQNIEPQTFFDFYENNHYKPLKLEFLKNEDLGVLKEILESGLIVKNFHFSNLNKKKFNSLDDLILFFYSKNSKKLKKQLLSLMIDGKFIDFKFLYLGQIIGHLDINLIYEILKNGNESFVFLDRPRPLYLREAAVYNHLKRFFPKQINANFFLKKTIDFQNLLLFLNKNNFLDRIPIKNEIKAKDFNDLLEKIELEYLILKKEGFDFPLISIEEKDSFVGEFSLKFPKTSLELKKWGDSLRNCLTADYWAIDIFSKKTVVGGLFKNDKLCYCIEIKNNKINQIEGSLKSKPSLELEGLILQKIRELKLIKD